jgi:dolichol-phosphate mannosyltransferase
MNNPIDGGKPNYSHCKFSLVLPFYNEEDNIVPVVTGLTEALERAGVNFQLVLVNNGSADRTPCLLAELAKGDPRLKPVLLENNAGYGRGVLSGLRVAGGEWIGYMDGDGQIVPGDLPRFLAEADSARCDMVKARRLVRRDGFIRARVSEIYVIFFCLLFGLMIYDVNAKPVLFRREWLKRFDLASSDWFIDAELMLKAVFLGLRIREVGITFPCRAAGRSSVRVATVLEFINNITRYSLGGEFAKWKKNQP